MCLLRYRQLDAKSRRIYSAGNLCLFTGIVLQLFPTGFAYHHHGFYLSLRFALICSAIVLLFWSARRSGGCATLPERNS